MAIASLADYLAAPKYKIEIRKDGTSATAGRQVSAWAYSGNYTAGSLAIGDTTAGLVPTDATTGAPTIPDFSGTGYLTQVISSAVDSSGTGPGSFWLYDRLYHAGSYANSAGTTTLSSQPSYSSRIPGGDYSCVEAFIETTATITGATTMNITYTDQSGNTGHTSGSVTIATSTFGNRLFKIPLASGDYGIQTLESFVISSAGSAGGFNVVFARKLARVDWGVSLSDERILWLDRTGMKQVYNDSCLWMVIGIASGNTFPTCTMDVEIASG